MSGDIYSERRFPRSFQDVINIRQVPDHQEVFLDPSLDESLIFELLDFKHDVGDNGSAACFLQDLATEQDAGRTNSQEWLGPPDCATGTVIITAVGQMV